MRVNILMLASISAIVGGLFIGTQSTSAGAYHSSKIGTWSGALVLEHLSVVPILCAVPALFHELANSRLLHALAPAAADVSLGASELLPALAVLPFMLYQLAGFGTLHFLVSRTANWAINLGILGLVVAATVANRMASYALEKAFVSLLVIGMVALVFYGVTKLRQMQVAYDTYCPPKDPK